MRKKKPPEHVNHERWLVSYADFITLLFAFFTTMYAISTVDAQKLGRLVYSMRASFDSPMFEPGSESLTLNKGEGGATQSKDLVEGIGKPKERAFDPTLVETTPVKPKNNIALNGEVVALGQLQQRIDAIIRKRGIASKVRTRLETRGLVICLDGTFFDSGDDQLRPEGRELMDALGNDLLSLGNQVRIEGHTDNVPIHTERFPSNWELSTARATSIVAYLIKKFGYRPDRIYGAGFAEFIPIASNDTAEGRARNRRVDIVVLNSSYTRMSQ